MFPEHQTNLTFNVQLGKFMQTLILRTFWERSLAGKCSMIDMQYMMDIRCVSSLLQCISAAGWSYVGHVVCRDRDKTYGQDSQTAKRWTLLIKVGVLFLLIIICRWNLNWLFVSLVRFHCSLIEWLSCRILHHHAYFLTSDLKPFHWFLVSV